MKTNEELNALKNEVETLNKKLAELSEEELEQVTGGSGGVVAPDFIHPWYALEPDGSDPEFRFLE